MDGLALPTPLESLTPPGWEARLEAIVERGLIASGAGPLPPPPWRTSDAAGAEAPLLRAELAAAGVPLAEGAGASELVVHAARAPLAGETLERLRRRCRERPTVLVGLQNDSFLDAVPEATLRLSAADSTPLTLRVVARTLARRLRDAAPARA